MKQRNFEVKLTKSGQVVLLSQTQVEMMQKDGIGLEVLTEVI